MFNGLVEVVFTNYMQATLRGEEGMTALCLLQPKLRAPMERLMIFGF